MRRKHSLRKTAVVTIVLFLAFTGVSQAWHDKTHLGVAKAAGYSMWYNATGPDVAKVKALGLEHKDTSDDDLPVVADIQVSGDQTRAIIMEGLMFESVHQE